MNWRAPIIKTNLHSRSVWIQRCASERARGKNFNSPYHSWSFNQTHVNTAIYINDNVLINLLNSQLACLSPKTPVTSQLACVASTLRDRGSMLFLLGERREEPLLTSARNRMITYNLVPRVSLLCLPRQHRETPLPVLETKRHFLLFRGNSLRQLRSKKTSVCRQLLFLRRKCRLKLQQKPIDWKFPMLFDLQRKFNSKQQFLPTLQGMQGSMLREFARAFERKVWRVQVAYLHNVARAASACTFKSE